MNNVFAFIVGIEKYQQAGWNMRGPFANALAITDWLLSIDVPPVNIFLFADPIEDVQDRITELKSRGVCVRATDWQSIDDFWRQELTNNRPVDSRLLVYWSGHGFVENDGDRVFICSDYTADRMINRVFNGTNFLRYLRSADFQCFAEQIFLADVCAVYAQLKFSADKSPPERLLASLKPIACFATPEGEYAKGNDGHGVFTDIALRVLDRSRCWPERSAFGKALRAELSDAGQRSFQVVYEDETCKWDRRVGSGLKDENSPLCNALFSLLNPIPLPDSVFRPHYLRTVSDLGNPELAKAQGLAGMIRELASLCDARTTQQLPYGLLEFLVRLTEEPELAGPISAWLASHASGQGHDIANFRHKILDESRQKILIVELETKDDATGDIRSFTPSLRMHNLDVVPGIRLPPEPVAGWEDFTGKMMLLIRKLQTEHEVTDFQVHFLADPPLFDWPFHSIEIADGITLGEGFVVVVRYRERLRHATSEDLRRWRNYAETLRCCQPGEVQLVPVNPPPAGFQPAKGLCYARFVVQPVCLGGSGGTAEKRQLLRLLRQGVPYLYWPHQVPSSDNWEGIKEDLAKRLGEQRCLDQFPGEFTSMRNAGDSCANQGTLLWDDPQFHPFLSPRGVEIK